MTTPPPPDALAAAGAELARVRALQRTTEDCAWTCPTCGWHTRNTLYEQHICIRAEQTAEHDTNGAEDE